MVRRRTLSAATHTTGAAVSGATASAGLRTAVGARCELVLRTWPGRLIVVVTVLAGVVSAVAVISGSIPGERTIAAASGPVQSLMSITVPFLGVLLVQTVQRPVGRRAFIAPGLALAAAVAVAVFGVVLCGLVTAVATSQAPGGRWHHAGAVAVGSLLVQIVAQLTGTGLGLLVRRPALACLLTIVLPTGLRLLLGALDALRPAQAWLTPYASAQHLLAGDMSPANWAQWLVMVAIWGFGLNLAGLRRRASLTPSALRS